MRGRGRPTNLLSAARRLVVLLLLGAPAAAQVGVPTAGPNEPLFWSRRELVIPYRWAGSTSGAEVVLYYSADQGRSWRVAGSAAPNVRSFRFQAPADGEHWFAVRTYDAKGTPSPAGPLAPEMRVVVDTSAPRVERFAAELTGGVLSVELAASDPAGFAAQPAYVYAQAAGQPGWTPLALATPQPSADGKTVRWTAQWRPPTGVTRVEVRATVEDRAGNRLEQTTAATAAAPGDNLIAAQRPTYGYAAHSTAAPPVLGTPAFGAPALGAPSLDPFADAERRTPAPSPLQPPAPQQPAFGVASFPSSSLAGAPQRDPATTPWPSELRNPRPLTTGALGANEGRGATPFSSASFSRNPLDPFADREAAAPAAAAPSRLVNNAEFEFDYELDRTGRWGVAKVELWGTDNGGRSWRRFAIDSDRESPIHVSTPGEGVYGFRLVVESIGGLEAPTPRPGDAPEAMVGVDLTKPEVTLGDARQGVGYFADQLVIEWRARDEHLAEAPIDLFYSNRATGPWIPIATNLPNNGRHSWRLQRHLPRRLFVRIEARDNAGNVAAATSPEALDIDVAVASGSLTGVRASGG